MLQSHFHLQRNYYFIHSSHTLRLAFVFLPCVIICTAQVFHFVPISGHFEVLIRKSDLRKLSAGKQLHSVLRKLMSFSFGVIPLLDVSILFKTWFVTWGSLRDYVCTSLIISHLISSLCRNFSISSNLLCHESPSLTLQNYCFLQSSEILLLWLKYLYTHSVQSL
jgi:hypothetical protein